MSLFTHSDQTTDRSSTSLSPGPVSFCRISQTGVGTRTRVRPGSSECREGSENYHKIQTSRPVIREAVIKKTHTQASVRTVSRGSKHVQGLTTADQNDPGSTKTQKWKKRPSQPLQSRTIENATEVVCIADKSWSLPECSTNQICVVPGQF